MSKRVSLLVITRTFNAPKAVPRLQVRGKEPIIRLAGLCLLVGRTYYLHVTGIYTVFWWSTTYFASYHGFCTIYTFGYPNSLRAGWVACAGLPTASASGMSRFEQCKMPDILLCETNIALIMGVSPFEFCVWSGLAAKECGEGHIVAQRSTRHMFALNVSGAIDSLAHT